MKIVGGPTIRINDPNGVYGQPYIKSPEFTADDENPSITAFSGFRKCFDLLSDHRLTSNSYVHPTGRVARCRFALPDEQPPCYEYIVGFYSHTTRTLLV